jgi:hypothetical protein
MRGAEQGWVDGPLPKVLFQERRSHWTDWSGEVMSPCLLIMKKCLHNSMRARLLAGTAVYETRLACPEESKGTVGHACANASAGKCERRTSPVKNPVRPSTRLCTVLRIHRNLNHTDASALVVCWHVWLWHWCGFRSRPFGSTVMSKSYVYFIPSKFSSKEI